MAIVSQAARPDLPVRPSARPNALAEIGFSSFASGADSDASIPGDDLDDDGAQDDDGSSVVGVSISPTQTRLASPRTPVVERVEAFRQSGGFFGDGSGEVDSEEEEHDADDRTASPDSHVSLDGNVAAAKVNSHDFAESGRREPLAEQPPEQSSRPDTLQTPVVDEKVSRKRSVKSKSIGSLGGVFSQRKRNSSLSDLSRRFHDLSLPSLPKASAFLQNFMPSPDATSNSKQQTSSNGTNITGQTLESEPSMTEPNSPNGREESVRPQNRPRRSTIDSRPGLARSLASADRMSLEPLSAVPSLGDDTRWVHVKDQVNSRKKAISDTLEDIKFPSLPNLNPLASFSFGPSSKNNSATDEETRAINSSNTKKTSATVEHPVHPLFSRALARLKGDVVILGGYRGSVLRSATSPDRRLWIPLGVTMNLRKVDLQVGLNVEDEQTEEERVVPDGMLTHIGPVDISRRLLRHLRDCKNVRDGSLRIHEWGYDWRLSPHLTSERFRHFLASLPCNAPGVEKEDRGALIIAHSLGGVITRHAINKQPDLISNVLYAGVPQHAVNILGPLRNGDDVALNSRILTAQVNFTIRTSFALLPLSGRCFYDKDTKEEYPVDFFDVEHWKEYCWSPVISRPHPPSVQQQTSTSLGSLVDSVSDMLSKASRTAEKTDGATSGQPAGVAPQMADGQDAPAKGDLKDPKTIVTIPTDEALAYLERTLAETKQFLLELAHRPELEAAGLYPRHALIYGKNIPTCKGAKVSGREGIKQADAYDALLFGSGDGVVLSTAAMLPAGYKAVRRGVVHSHKSHVSLLSDLEAVGKCLLALFDAGDVHTRKQDRSSID